MASILSTSVTFLPSKLQSTMGGQRLVILKCHKRSSHSFNTKISCSTAEPETLKIVAFDETMFAPAIDLSADSLDTVEIKMALEEQFGVSIGESGAENISTVQDSADLTHKVKTADAS